jgi:DNA-binding transcriptional MerR regulator/methylmalonyl-CoA mutase cobalamin-binding subunit
MPESYPISAAAKLTGLPLDTLRAWERRYKAVVPLRAERGRLYSEEQIQRLILLRRTLEQGHSIGQVASLTDRQLRQLLEKSSSFSVGGPVSINKDTQDILSPVLRALERFDTAGTDREINRLAAAIASPREFVHQVALPLMRTVGTRWHEGKCSIAQEHILTRYLGSVLTSFVRAYSRSDSSARVLIATPRHERHEFPILTAAMLTAAAGVGVIYVGADLPAADIVLAARKTDADVALLSLSTAPNKETLEELDFVARKTPRTTALWLGGAAELNLKAATAGSRWVILPDFSALENHLAALAASS